MTGLQLARYDGASAKGMADELVDVYAEVYDVPPYREDPFFSVASYADRLHAAFGMRGFETVTARRNGELVGYVHGVTLPPDRSWWVSLAEQRPDGLLGAAEREDIFWLRELMVRPACARQGVGRRLHDAIIAGRGESVTALTCITDNEPAHGIYLRWGYTIMGRIKHAPESPVYDAMYRPAGRTVAPRPLLPGSSCP
ncbi:GNAT family N-acetyltransferase [Streptomyces sp. DSM 44917]|uniref:GNAT family N-acetyltransferase n=1 Tax=Streptomyces boetiae TaxID=3075541 RepID=A0ABU2L7W1_9ACTN|nr:GNAT family N-acetyltransferase [Streptomyces sp. DSM 44917]MDT0307655.1 GNAT family N-acetyltransferase [Streptomyces sp. DSM 44917]